MTYEYLQALKELERARANYEQVDKEFEAVAFRELQAAEERVMILIREIKTRREQSEK